MFEGNRLRLPSLALSVKMSILLFAPAFAYLFLLGNGMSIAVIHGVQVLGLQVSVRCTRLPKLTDGCATGFAGRPFSEIGLEILLGPRI